MSDQEEFKIGYDIVSDHGYVATFDTLRKAMQEAESYAESMGMTTRVVKTTSMIIMKYVVEKSIKVTAQSINKEEQVSIPPKPKVDAGFTGKCGICNDPNCDNPSGKH